MSTEQEARNGEAPHVDVSALRPLLDSPQADDLPVPALPQSEVERRPRRGGDDYRRASLKTIRRAYEALGRDAARAGQCMICRAHNRSIVIDHDHATGRVRGFLCGRCNITLGFLSDDPVWLVGALEYLLATSLLRPDPVIMEIAAVIRDAVNLLQRTAYHAPKRHS